MIIGLGCAFGALGLIYALLMHPADHEGEG